MAHLLLLKISDRRGRYAIAKHITNNINADTWPDVPWVKSYPKKKLLKKEILHFAVDMQDLLQAEYNVKSRCADDPLNMTEWVKPFYPRRPRSEEAKRKQSEAMKKKPPFTEQHKANISAAMRRGFKDGTRAVNISYHNAENVDQMNKKIKSNPYNQDRPKIKCPHCYKIVSINMYHRWHGDKCKNNW